MASAPVWPCLLPLACLLLASQAAVIDGKDGAGFPNFDGADTPDFGRILSEPAIMGGHLESRDNSEDPPDKLAAAWLDVLDILEREVTDAGQRNAIQEAVGRFSSVLMDEIFSSPFLCQEEEEEVAPRRRLARSLEVRNRDAAGTEVDDDHFQASNTSTSTEDSGLTAEPDEAGEPDDSWLMKWKKMKAERKALRKAARKARRGEGKVGRAEKRAQKGEMKAQRKAERKAARKAERKAEKKAGRKAAWKAERKEARKAGKMERKKQWAARKAARKAGRKEDRSERKAARKAERKAARKAGRKADRKATRKAARKAERKAHKKAFWKKQRQEWLARRQGYGEAMGESEATMVPDELGHSGDDSTDVTVLVPVIAST